MKLSDLQKIKNKSVQVQNEITYLEMKEEAESYLTDKSYCWWLSEVLESEGISSLDGILISLSDVPEQGGMEYFATWLASDSKFYEVTVLIPYGDTKSFELDQFVEVFPRTNEHCPGTGKSEGFIALQLLNEYKVNKLINRTA